MKIKSIKGTRFTTKLAAASMAVILTAAGMAMPANNVTSKVLPAFSITADAAGTYNTSSAVNYAYKYWSSYNPNYKNYNSVGGDCCNFVSQCLYAGGLKTDKTWYNGSGAWINCAQQRTYLSNQGYQLINNAKASDCRVGDVVYYYYGSSIAQTAIVTKVSGGNVYVTAHNKNHKDYEWTLGGANWWGGSTRRDVVHITSTSNGGGNNNQSVNWPSISTGKPLKVYATSNSHYITVYTNANLTSVDKNRYIYGDEDEIWVYSIGKNSRGQMYAYASYPTSGGRRNVYIPLSTFTSASKPTASRTAKSQITTYKKAGGATYGYISAGDSVLKLGTSGSYTQIIYPVTNSSNQVIAYKAAYIKTTEYNNKTR